MEVLIIIVLGVIGLLVWQIIQTKNALATTVVATSKTLNEAAVVINDAFTGARGLLWTDANGPAKFNKRRRGKDRGITMAIDIEPSPNGGSQVSMWATDYTEYFIFFANFAGSVNSRKKAITRALTS